MATGKPILFKDVIQQGNPYMEAIEGARMLIETEDKLIKTLNESLSTVKKIGVNSGKEYKKLNGSQKQIVETTNQLTAVAKQELKLREKLSVAASREGKAVVELNERLKQQNQINRLIARENIAKAGSYAKLSAQMSLNILKHKNMSAVTKKEIKERDLLGKKINQQNSQLKRLDSTMGKSQRHVGKYTNAMKGLGSQLLLITGVGGGLYSLVRLFRSSIKTISDFGKENAVLAGVLGVTRKETTALQNAAVKLGKYYPTLTSEVTQLQIAYARLGFTQREILNLTEPTIVGSIALNSGLEETATLVGATVKAFDDLKSEDAPEIMDQLTRSTTLTSLNFEKLSTALPKVMGAANAMNIPLGKTLSLLGIAQDATQDASISGTSLRNIFIQLAKSGQTLEEGLDDIVQSQNKLTTANDKFGKRAAITALALANNIEKIKEYNTEITTATGLTGTIAEEQMNTLDGAIKRVSSAWEAMILSMRGSEGVMKSFMENIATALGNIESFGTGGFLAGLFGIGKKEMEEARKEVTAFYNTMKTASKEELSVWLQTTTTAYAEAKEAGDTFMMSMTARRARHIAERIGQIYMEGQQVKVVDGLMKEAAIQREIIYQQRLKAIREQYGSQTAERAAKKEWINEEMALLNSQKDDKIKADEEVRASLAETISWMEDKHEITMQQVERDAKATKDAEEAKAEIREITQQSQLDSAMRSFDALLMIMDEESTAYKALASAQALIATFVTAQKSASAVADIPLVGPALAAAAYAAAILQGIATISQINDVEFAEGTEYVEGGTPGKDSVRAMLMPGERVVPTEINQQLGGIPNEALPGLLNIPSQAKSARELKVLGQIAFNTERSNRYLKSGLKWTDKHGNIYDVEGNKTTYLN